MDALQVISSAMQIVSSMVAAIGSIQQAYRNLDDAPKRIRVLEEFVCELEILTRRVGQKHVYKLQNSRLDNQIQSLNKLIELLRPNITKARKIVSKNKVKNVARVLWHSMAGDPLGKVLSSMHNDLNWWLESQRLVDNIESVIERTARNISNRLKVTTDHDYPISSKCTLVRSLLEKDDSHSVILIVGLSGIGKTCLARQVASDPPLRFLDGAIELGFGQWCSRAACGGDRAEYQKRLTRKLSKFLLQIGFQKKMKEEHCIDLDRICCMLQEALYGKSILIFLDDVWEQDIVERFAKLYDNNCRYLVTTRNESVYEITEAEKVEVNKDDIREISKSVLLYHSLLTEDELPAVADTLLGRCGYHPLTVAVVGKALRSEVRSEKWEKAIADLSMYAACAPGPISYVNEKEAENTLTIFGSLEFSLKAMPEDSRRLFIAFASLSWVEPLPEVCLEAIWSVLGQENLFPLTVCKLVEGSLLIKTESNSLYQVHDMVSLYLDGKITSSIDMLLTEPAALEVAFITPWLFIFGKDTVKTISEEKIYSSLLNPLQETQALILIEAINQAFMASISISELEASRASFSRILGPRIADLLSAASEDLVAGSAKAIINIFTKSDFSNYFPSLETVGAVDKLAGVLENSDDPTIQSNVSIILAKLAEFGNPGTINEVLHRIPLSKLAELLSSHTEEWHDSVFTTFLSLIKAGNSKAVDRMYAAEVDKSLIKLLEDGSDVAQHHALVILKLFYELGGPTTNGLLGPSLLKLLPWQARFRLERFVLSDQNSLPSPKPQTFDDIIRKLFETNEKLVLEAMQDLIPIIENADRPNFRDMILKSPLIRRLSELLSGHQEQHFLRSESAFILTKLACFAGEPCIKKILDHDIIPELVKIMQCNIPELQDSVYTTLHQMLFAKGGVLVLNQMLQMGLVEKLLSLLESKSSKTREVSLNCVLDIVEVGTKTCLERMFSLQVVERLVKIDKSVGGSGENVVAFLKGISKCKHLTTAERWVMKQQVVRKAKTALKGHKFEMQILAAIEASLSEGSKGSTSSRRPKR